LFTKKCRGVAALIPVALVLTACTPSLTQAAIGPAGPAVETNVPLVVEGSLPGYTDSKLTQAVSACVAQVPMPGTMPNEPHAGWQMRVDVRNIYMPHSFTEIRMSLMRETHILAVRSGRQMALDAAPRAALCMTVSNLTQQLWASMATSDAPSKS
jgi:hypothetical protein